MKDGLYQVTYGTMCAGFTVRDGVIEFFAPILHMKLAYHIKWVWERCVKV